MTKKKKQPKIYPSWSPSLSASASYPEDWGCEGRDTYAKIGFPARWINVEVISRKDNKVLIKYEKVEEVNENDIYY